MRTFLIALAIGLALALLILLLPYSSRAQTPSAMLDWTAPGDDGNIGTASSYELRYRSVGISGTDTLGWWNAAIVVPSMPVPRVAGTLETVTISSGFNWATTYYFIIKACDDGLPGPGIPNCSGFSNVAVKTFGPAPDSTAPRRVIDLIVR